MSVASAVLYALMHIAVLVDLNEFLIPEIKMVGKLVGYKEDEIPLPKFTKIMLEDKTQADRIFAQMATI